MAFETRKIFSNKIVIILILFTAAVSFAYYSCCVVGTFSSGGAYGMYDRDGNVYERFGGEVTEGKIAELKELIEETAQTEKGDLLQAQDLLSLAEYIENYNKSCEAKIKSAQRIKAENAALTESSVYIDRLADKVISHYQNRRQLQLGDYSAVNYFGWTQNFTYPSLLLILLCAFVSAELFCAEKRSGVYKINFTSKNGRLSLYKNKLAALAVFSLSVAGIFTAVQLAAVFLKYSISEINAPLQINELFADCPFNIGFLQYVWVILGTRFLGCLFVCALAAFAAVLTDNLIAAAVGTTGVGAALFWLYQSTLEFYGNEKVAVSKVDLHHDVMRTSPICLLNSQCYFVSNDYTDILNFPVTDIVVNITMTVIFIALLTVIGGVLFVRKRRRCS